MATTRWALGLSEAAVAGAAKQAVDLVLADGRLGSREDTFIDQLQTALQIEGDLARKILDVLLIKNRVSGRPDV